MTQCLGITHVLPSQQAHIRALPSTCLLAECRLFSAVMLLFSVLPTQQQTALRMDLPACSAVHHLRSGCHA